jgi:hypothetical protein
MRDHRSGDPQTHLSLARDVYGVTVSVEQDPGQEATIGVDHGPGEYLTLTPVQCHELGMALVRTADVLRREAQR